MVILALGLIVWTGRRTGETAGGLLFFGGGFLACVSFFGVLSLLLTADGEPSRSVWFAIQFAIGLAIIGAGIAFHVLTQARERA